MDGDVRGRDVVAAVLERGADAVAAFADSCVGQADGVKVVLVALDAGAVDFDLNNVGIDAVDGGAESFVEHVVIPISRKRGGKWGTRSRHAKSCGAKYLT